MHNGVLDDTPNSSSGVEAESEDLYDPARAYLTQDGT